ncbi:MAG TPA: LacI family DNA-binding transcriptional regulator [Terriglobales bacterium]|nr:LacI family DNA-binding transcriptional regulator [Terriglobales bacterium]
MPARRRNILRTQINVTLRTVAERVGLAPCSVSAVLNNSPAARGIPQHTKDRVLRAAAELRYRPNLNARSLRTKRTHLVAVLAADLGDAQLARMIAAMEAFLRSRGYSLLVAAWGGSAAGLELHAAELWRRGVEGLVISGAALPRSIDLPAVSLAPAQARGDISSNFTRDHLATVGRTAARALLAKIGQRIGDPNLTTMTEAFPPQMGWVPSTLEHNPGDGSLVVHGSPVVIGCGAIAGHHGIAGDLRKGRV